ncbi:Na+/H+ antiporter NhaC family protein [Tissierella sp.]|uniref:Na+/H+ antiporter NhaC family protein n=1 Tax=Tissierella sp. TaxID=41274 RepID=UPI0028652D5F|nr:Na+/H+ antiporter NhaC family protein [Tissierella sp.]MDR7856986.1 Na+/H+ antiporter NhaC family protein [Tissierella sp.]
MDPVTNFGILSLLPALVAVILAFITREAVFSLLMGVLVGILVTGQNILFGFTGLAQSALGNADFIWVLSIEVFVGIMIAFFQKSGAIDSFSKSIEKINVKAKGAQVIAWLLGIFIFFSDYFSPLYVGTVMRDITDKARVSREKLAYICDSTSAPVCTIIPFSSWGVYVAGLLVGIGAFTDNNIAMNAIVKMVPYNFYGLLSLVMVGLIAVGIIPDFGPMKKAEDRARETGKVMSDEAKPLLGKELSEIKPNEGIKPNLFLNFFAPAIIIISVTLGTYVFTGSAKTLEGFVLAVAFQFVMMIIQKMGTVVELMETAVQGIKGIVSAVLILALAYSLNAISKELGTANYVISIASSWMTPALLLVFTFLIGAFISFFTGTSWGTYAILTPIVIPLAFDLTGGQITSLVYATIAAVMGGGCFGDHCSPLSDTTILSSLGAGSDHIDHVKTQIPYAFTVAGVSAVLYLTIGFVL